MPEPSVMLQQDLLRLFYKAFMILTIGLSSLFAVADTISGTMSIEDNRYLIQEKHSNKSLFIKALTMDVHNLLDKLSTGDFLSANGSIINNEAVLDTLDFVGFKILIGVWQSGSYRISFSDFSVAEATLPIEIFSQTVKLKYSISPSENTLTNNSWKIFFSSQNKVQSATIEFIGENFKLKFYDADSGALTRQLMFRKISEINYVHHQD